MNMDAKSWIDKSIEEMDASTIFYVCDGVKEVVDAQGNVKYKQLPQSFAFLYNQLSGTWKDKCYLIQATANKHIKNRINNGQWGVG